MLTNTNKTNAAKRIAIVTLGTLGDLQPYIALAIGLKASGYHVLLISSKKQAEFANRFGLSYHSLEVDIEQLMQTGNVQKMAKSDNALKFFSSHLRTSALLKETMLAVQEEVWQACQQADLIIYHPGMPNGYFIAKEKGIPAMMASPFPVTATGDYPAMLFYNSPKFGKYYNLLTHYIFEKIFWMMSKNVLKLFWAKKNKAALINSIPPTRLQVQSGMPVLYAYSGLFFKRPSSWQDHIYVTGNWMLHDDADWEPPLALVSFLNSGSVPLYAGFGSMKNDDGYTKTLGVIIQALQITGQRAILAIGWNEIDAETILPDNIFVIKNIPHAWLFPKVAAVIHHGGAGTTAAGLYAGKPAIIIPQAADQPAWGKRIYELGVGAMPIPAAQLTSARLASAIRYVSQPSIIDKAAQAGITLQKENGVATAVAIINNYLNKVDDADTL